MEHTAHGWWLAEAGPIAPLPSLSGDERADVVVLGGGYLGMWTAWFIAEHDPGARVVLLEAEVCGHGPSGRNGGFATSWWDELHELRARFGDAAALELARASSGAVDALGAWCEAHGVDAWFRRGGELHVAAAPAQDGAWAAAVAACAELGEHAAYGALRADEVAARCASPVLRGGALLRDAATVQPARLALGLRERLIEHGVVVFERSRVRRLSVARSGAAAGERSGGRVTARGAGGPVTAETDGGRVTARSAVLALNAATAAVRPLRRRLTVGTSHIVLTEPVPDVLEAIGWSGGEAIADARTFLHYLRTTPDGRIAFGWAGGRMGYGARTRDVDGRAAAETRRALVRFFPALAGRRITHAWGGPIDIAPTHIPFYGSLTRDHVHYGAGFTGNGVAPSHLGGRILAALALDRRTPETQLAIVESEPVRVPPEPLTWAGASLIRAAYLRREAREEAGGRPDPLTAFVTELPRRLGLHLGR